MNQHHLHHGFATWLLAATCNTVGAAGTDPLYNALPMQVAQEQLAEYASEKSAAASAVLQQAEALEGTLQQLLAAAGGSSAGPVTPEAVAAAMTQLKAQLAQAAVEAQAFAEQQQADVERAKRSSRQVGSRSKRALFGVGRPCHRMFPWHTQASTLCRQLSLQAFGCCVSSNSSSSICLC